MAIAAAAAAAATMITSSSKFLRFGVQCSDNSSPRRGFGSKSDTNTNNKVSIPCFSFQFTHFGHTHNLINYSLYLPSFLASFLNKRKCAAAAQGRKRVWRYNKGEVSYPIPSHPTLVNYLLISFLFLSIPFLLSLIIAASVFVAENQLLNNLVPRYLLVCELLLPSCFLISSCFFFTSKLLQLCKF